MYDISMLSRDQVLALINQSSGLSLTWEQVEFGEPVAATGETPERNTELVITGIPNSGYRGTATIMYDRINLAEFKPLVTEAVLQVDGEPTIEKLLASFNELFGSNLELEDIRDDHSIPTAAEIEDGLEFTLRAAAASYAYRGDVSLTIQPLDVDIDLAIEDKMLDGLVLQQPTEGE